MKSIVVIILAISMAIFAVFTAFNGIDPTIVHGLYTILVMNMIAMTIISMKLIRDKDRLNSELEYEQEKRRYLEEKNSSLNTIIESGCELSSRK